MADSLDAIILAGGLGTRLRPVVQDVPKPLAAVAGRPFLDILLRQLQSFRMVRRVVLAIGYKAEMIQDTYRGRRDFGFEIEFSVEGTPLGTGGALLEALPLTRSERVLLLNGDSYVDFDLEAMQKAHTENRALMTMVVTQVDDVSRYGSVSIDPAGHKVRGFAEKGGRGGRGLINAGCYLIERRLIEGLEPGARSWERDLLPTFMDDIFVVHASGRFIDIGLPETYRLASDLFA